MCGMNTLDSIVGNMKINIQDMENILDNNLLQEEILTQVNYTNSFCT